MDFFVQGRMLLGRGKLHTCLPKYLDQPKGTQMAEADKGVSYCVVFSAQDCFEFVFERGEEDNYVNMFILIHFTVQGRSCINSILLLGRTPKIGAKPSF